MRKRIDLGVTVPLPLRADVMEKLAHVSDRISWHELSPDGTNIEIEIDSLTASGDHRTDDDAVAVQVRELVLGMTKRYRDVERVVVFDHTPPGLETRRPTTFEELALAGLVSLEGSGCVALTGDLLNVLEALDRRIVKIACEKFDAVPWQYPTMIATKSLERCHYFASFPHHVTFALNLREDLTALEQIAKKAEHDPSELANALAPPAHVLSPAVCFHAYIEHQDRPLVGRRVVTARGRCFRYESRNFAGLERLWDFTLREVIFLGDETSVEESRQAWVREIGELCKELSLHAWIETATDPFFLNNFVAQRYFQLVSHTKYELRLALPYAENRSVAAASLNSHRDFFGSSFGIRRQDAPTMFASTACVGFGLERFAFALFAQLGRDVKQWPKSVHDALAIDR